eukprot:TRINITY_DN2317_c0_g4_i1.p1 TRINITY_DN2317_c0_g4~~TRINITY_DN2317_c0_g4_i1.p1  ORF type:complete len:363 (-),score=57.07 TRINITY_DN2317_c0_g4_i1:536-1624(-)
MKVRVAVGPGLFPIEVLPTDTVWTLKWKIYQDEDIWEYFHRFRTNLSFSLPPPDDQELTGKNVWNGWIRLDDCERSLKSYSIHEGSEIKCRKIREVTEGHHKCFSTLLDGLRKRKSHLSVIDGTPVSWVKHASIHTHEVRSIQLELVENETWYLKSLIYVEGVIHVMSSLKELDLSGNEEIGIEGWIHITQALETNTSLKTLDLHECSIKSDSAARLGQMLEKNSSLSTLNLNYNSEIGEEGWNAITKALENNTSLKTLDLCWCEIGSAVAIRIGEMLGKNSSLRKLGLSCTSHLVIHAHSLRKTRPYYNTCDQTNLSPRPRCLLTKRNEHYLTRKLIPPCFSSGWRSRWLVLFIPTNMFKL